MFVIFTLNCFFVRCSIFCFGIFEEVFVDQIFPDLWHIRITFIIVKQFYFYSFARFCYSPHAVSCPQKKITGNVFPALIISSTHWEKRNFVYPERRRNSSQSAHCTKQVECEKNAFPLFKQILFSLAGLKYDRMAKHQGKEYRFLFVRADGMQLEKITRIVETNKIVPQINSTWALPIKIVNAKKLLQVFAIFLNAFSILIGSGYSWFRCRFIAFGNVRAPLLSLAHLLAMYLIQAEF